MKKFDLDQAVLKIIPQACLEEKGVLFGQGAEAKQYRITDGGKAVSGWRLTKDDAWRDALTALPLSPAVGGSAR